MKEEEEEEVWKKGEKREEELGLAVASGRPKAISWSKFSYAKPMGIISIW